MSDNERYNAALDALSETAQEVTEVRSGWREFKLALLIALDVTDPWAIATWRQVDYVRAIERLRADTKRLDWLEAQVSENGLLLPPDDVAFSIQCHMSHRPYALREAIDIALAASATPNGL